MLNLDDLLAANIACRLALLGPQSLRQLLSELDAQAPPGSFIPALRQRGFAPDRVQHLEHATRQRRAQLETQYFVGLARARGAVDPGTLQALSQQQARDGYRWSLADQLVSRGFLSAAACLALTHEAMQQLVQREQQLIQENRRQGYALVLDTGTTSGRHLTAANPASSSSGRSSPSDSGSYPNPDGSGLHRVGSGSYPVPGGAPGFQEPAGFDAERTQPVEPPSDDFSMTLPVDGPPEPADFSMTLPVDGPVQPYDPNMTLPVDGPPMPFEPGATPLPVEPPAGSFDPERTMAFQETLNVPQGAPAPPPPPEPEFDAGAPTMMLPPGSQGIGDPPGPGLGSDPCRTIGFEQVLMTPVGQSAEPDAMDIERTITLPAPKPGAAPQDDLNQPTINLPPPSPIQDPFGTMTAEPALGGGLDATITIRPDLGEEDAGPDMPPGLERVRELGRGNMGIVYLARQPDQRLVAVKVIKNATKDSAARFRREILVSAKVQHAHVIEVLDSGTLPNGTSFMAMEYLEGRELKELIQVEAPLSLSRCLELLDQVFAALEAVHAAEIVHRDLKPENVQVLTLRGGDHIKLVDFGISRLLTQDEDEAEDVFVTMRGTLSGTPMYVAPEAIVDPDLVTKAHDIYAAGVILYEMLTGKLPFKANRTLRDLLRDTVHSRPTPLEEAHPTGEFPPAIQRLVARLLDKDDQARPADGAAARQLLRDTQRALNGDTASNARTESMRRPGITERLLRKITGIFRRDSSGA